MLKDQIEFILATLKKIVQYLFMHNASNWCKIALFMKAYSNCVMLCLDSHSGEFVVCLIIAVFIFAILFDYLRLRCISLFGPGNLIDSNDTS